MADCDRCGRPQHADTAHGCTGCAARADQALATVGERLADLADTIARQTASGVKRVTGAGDAHPLPINAGAAEVRRDLEAKVLQWARRIESDHNAPMRRARAARLLPADPLPRRVYEGPECASDECWHKECAEIRERRRPRKRAIEPGETLVEVAAEHIRAHLDWLRHQAYAARAFSDIEHAMWAARGAVDTSPERRYLGRCFEPVSDTEECTAEILAVVGAAHATCRAGLHTWDVQRRYDWLLQRSRDYNATVTEISKLLSILLGATIGKDTINSWIRRGELRRAGQIDGVAVYRLGTAIDLAVRAQSYKAKREAAAARAKAEAKKKAAAKASAKRAAQAEAAAKAQVKEVPA